MILSKLITAVLRTLLCPSLYDGENWIWNELSLWKKFHKRFAEDKKYARFCTGTCFFFVSNIWIEGKVISLIRYRKWMQGQIEISIVTCYWFRILGRPQRKRHKWAFRECNLLIDRWASVPAVRRLGRFTATAPRGAIKNPSPSSTPQGLCQPPKVL